MELERFTQNTKVRFIGVALFAIVAANQISLMIAERCANENLYRKHVEQAQLADLNNDYAKFGQCLRNAIQVATSLGDDNKDIADLYIKLSSIDERQPSKTDAKIDLRKAISLYKKVPFTNLQQIRAEERLLSILMVETHSDTDIGVGAVNENLYTNFQQRVIPLLDHGKFDLAIYAFRKYLYRTEFKIDFAPDRYPPNFVQNGVKTLNAKIQDGNPLAIRALPLMEEFAYFSDLKYWHSPLSVREANLRVAYLMVDEMIAKTGRDPNDFKTRKRLGDQAFEHHNFRCAIMEYQRCLGMQDDLDTRLKLQKANFELQPKCVGDPSEIFATLEDLKKLRGDSFGANSKHVTKTLERLESVYAAWGNYANAVQLRKEIVARELVYLNMEERLDNDFDMNGISPKIIAYEGLLNWYLGLGNFKEARTLFNSALEKFSAKERTHAENFYFLYELICLRAGWYKEAAKLPSNCNSTTLFVSHEIK